MNFGETLTCTVWEFKTLEEFRMACRAHHAARIRMTFYYHRDATEADRNEMMNIAQIEGVQVNLVQPPAKHFPFPSFKTLIHGMCALSVTALLLFLTLTSKGVEVTFQQPRIKVNNVKVNNELSGEATTNWNLEGSKMKLLPLSPKFQFWPSFK